MLYAGSHQKSDCRSAKSCKRSGEGEGAGAAFGRVLFRQPQRVNRKIRAAKAKKEKTNEEPGKRGRPKIKYFSKREGNESKHQREVKPQSAAPANFLREPGHRQTSENRCEGNEHGRTGSKLRRQRADLPGRFSERRHHGPTVTRSAPAPPTRRQH